MQDAALGNACHDRKGNLCINVKTIYKQHLTIVREIKTRGLNIHWPPTPGTLQSAPMTFDIGFQKSNLLFHFTNVLFNHVTNRHHAHHLALLEHR